MGEKVRMRAFKRLPHFPHPSPLPEGEGAIKKDSVDGYL